MEYVDGPSLTQYMKTVARADGCGDGRWPSRLGIANGLGAAHAKGTGASGYQAGQRADGAVRATSAGAQRSPTLGWWRPKKQPDDPDREPAADHGVCRAGAVDRDAGSRPGWAHGFLCAGRRAVSDADRAAAVLWGELPRIRAEAPEHAAGGAEQHSPGAANWRGLDPFVLRLLAKDRSDRPQDVAELLSLLEAVVYEPGQTEAAARPTGQPHSQASGNYGEYGEPVMSNPSAQYVPARRQHPAQDRAQNPTFSSAQASSAAGEPAQAGSDDSLATGRVYQVNTEGRSSRKYVTQSGALKAKREAARKGFPAWGWIVILVLLGGGGFAAQHFMRPGQSL